MWEHVFIDPVNLGGLAVGTSTWCSGGLVLGPRWVRQHSFVEIDHEIFSTAILSLPLIQEVQLLVAGEIICTRHHENTPI